MLSQCEIDGNISCMESIHIRAQINKRNINQWKEVEMEGCI